MSLQAKFFTFVAACVLLTATVAGVWCYQHHAPSHEMIVFYLMVVGAALLSVYLATSWFVCRPLRNMTRDMERIAQGREQMRPLSYGNRTDELGMAARAFNQMVDTALWSTTALQASNNELEKRIVRRTEEIERRNKQEMTEAKDAAIRLSAAEQKYRSIFENATEGIFQTSLEGDCLSANPAMVRLLGYDSTEEASETLTNLSHQLYADPMQRKQFLERLLRDGKIEQFVTEVIRKDGRRIWISTTARVVRGADGEQQYLEGTVRDVTAQRVAETDLRRSEAEARKLAIVASRTHNPVVITSPDGRLEWANTAFTELTGYALDDLRGKKPGELLQGPETDPVTVKQMRECITAGQPFKVEVVNYDRNGRKYWLSIDAEPVKDSSGQVQKFIALQEDITERKRAQWLERDRRLLLEMVARNESLTNTLQAVCRAGERQCEQLRSAVLLYDGKRRYAAAAPQFSPEFIKQLSAVVEHATGLIFVNSSAGDSRLLTRSNSPHLSQFWNDPEAEDIVACTAVPIVAGTGAALGEFVVFYTKPPTAPESDRKVLQSLAGLTGLAIEHNQLTARLAYQATHDPLTGLPNRIQLESQLPLWIGAAAREKQVMAVLMIDLDGFKHVNDTLGHPVGDMLLQQVAIRLSKATRASDVLVRTGGDEFTLLATELSCDSDADCVANRVIEALSAPCEVDGRELFVTSSIGIAVYPEDGLDAASLQRSADAAMYAAKAAGRNQAQRYDPQMSAAAVERLELEGLLRRAIENQELHLHYQPQVNRTGFIVGVEALLRWRHPRHENITPARFIPVAEQSGLIIPIGTWVLREACRQAKSWQTAGCPAICIAVNVSALQFQQPDFVDLVSSALSETGLEPTMLELELTESLLLTNINDVLKKLSALREMGVGIAIDDFGTGYSSLAYLQKLPIDRLKIDQSFIRELSTESVGNFSQTAVISAIVSLAGSLGKGVVAEGVETLAQRDYLIDIGCGTLQGYLYSAPVAPDRMEKMLLARRMEPVRLAISA